jgi:NAD(P) transhydrogenase subunit alpha
VRSLGAKFVKIDLGETGETKDGYAKALTEEQLQKQRDEMAKRCAASDIVITAARVFGRKAPVIVTSEMIGGMKPGSVIVDCAVETGGNVEGSRPDEEIEQDGVKIVGLINLPGEVALDASLMYGNNVANLVEHLWDSEAGSLKIDFEDEIIKGCVITHDGEVVNETIREAMNAHDGRT